MDLTIAKLPYAFFFVVFHFISMMNGLLFSNFVNNQSLHRPILSFETTLLIGAMMIHHTQKRKFVMRFFFGRR